MDVSHIYGLDNSRQMALRSMTGGKMKVHRVNGEDFPPKLSDAPVEMIYPADYPEASKVSRIRPHSKTTLEKLTLACHRWRWGTRSSA